MTQPTIPSKSITSVRLVALAVSVGTFAGCSSEKTPAPAAPAPTAAAQTTAAAQPSAATKPAAPAEAMTGGGVTQSRMVDVEPGVAGGVIEDTSTLTARVVAVDRPTRKVTLADDAGNKASFTAGPEVRNLDQLQAGDKVTATMKDRLVVYVRGAHAGDEAGATYAAALAAAPKGAKPGALVAEAYELIAVVTAIDATKRTATLKFSDDSTRTVNVRPDVDLSHYKVGDRVIIRVTSTLSVLAENP